MAVTVTVLGSAANCVNNFTGNVQVPSAWSLTQFIPFHGGGNWLVCLLAWRQQAQLGPVTFSVGDDGHNYWEPLGAPTGTSTASGVTRCSIWYAPAARPCRAIVAAPSAAYLTAGAIVLEVDGLTPWLSLSALTTGFARGTSLPAMTLAAPASQMVTFTVCGSDLTTSVPSLAGAGWTTTGATSANNGLDHSEDLVISGGYQVTSSAVSATWSAGSTQDFAGVTAGFLVSGGTAPSAAQSFWPATVTELALGAGASTPADQLAWTPVTARTMNMDITQGRQYQLAALQTGSGSVTFDNPDGDLIPPGSGPFAGIDSGTPIRTRMTWAGPPWQLQLHGNGTTAQPGASSGHVLPVAAGNTYTATAYVAMSLVDAAGAGLTLQFYNSGGTLLSSATWTTTAAGTQFALASGTAPAGAVTAAVVIGFQGTPLAGNVLSAAAGPPGPVAAGYLTLAPSVTWTPAGSATITLSSSWAFDKRGAPQTSPHNVVFSGFCQKWPQQWTADTQRGIVTASLVDAWNYCNGNLQPIILDEVLNDQPYAYWPLTDAQGSGQAANQAPGNGNPLIAAASKYGSGGSTQAFGANSSALLGAQGTLLLTSSVRQQAQSGMWQQALPSTVTSVAILGQGYSLSCTDQNFPPVSGVGQTIEFWFQVTAPFQTGVIESVLVVRNTATALFSLCVSQTSSLLWLCEGSQPIIPSGAVAVGDAGVDYRSMPNLEHFAITFGQNTWNVYIDGQLTASGSWSPSLVASYSTLSFNSDTIQPQGNTAPGALPSIFNAFNGYIAHVAVYDYEVPQGRLFTHYLAGQFASTEDSGSPRIERILEAGNYLGRRVIIEDNIGGFTATMASCQDVGGQPASTSIANVTASLAPAVFTVTPQGELFYYPRYFCYSRPAKWILGDLPPNGEYVYDGSNFLIDYDPARVLNDIQLTQLDRQDIVIPDISQVASQAQYGDNTYWQTGYLFNDPTTPATSGSSLSDLANWILTANISPSLRPSQVTVDAAANPANWPFVLGAAAGDMVQVIRRPPTSGQVLTYVGRISQHQRTISAGMGGSTGAITCTIDPAPEASVLVLSDPVLGLINGTNRLAW